MKKIIMGFLMLMLVGQGRAAEHWARVSNETTKWSDPTAMVLYKDTLFLASKWGWDDDEIWENNPKFWKSLDGEIWEPILLPLPGFNLRQPIIYHFLEYNENLYAFAVDRDNPWDEGTAEKYVFHFDGTNWTLLNQDFGQGGFWADVVSYGNYVYASTTRGVLWRSSLDNLSSSWESNPFFENLPFAFSEEERRGLYLANFNQEFILVANLLSTVDNREHSSFYKLTDESNWQDGENGWENINIGFNHLTSAKFVHENKLYWGGRSSLTVFEDEVSNSFDKIRTYANTGLFGVPFEILGSIHIAQSGGDIRMFREDRSWETVFAPDFIQCSLDRPVFGKAVKFGKKTFVLPCNLMVLEEGFRNVSFVGSSDNTVLPTASFSDSLITMKTQVNVQDKLLSFRIKNEATFKRGLGNSEVAIAGRDIAQMYLIQEREFQGFAGTINWVQLTAISDTEWVLPAGTTLDVQDGDTLKIQIYVARDAHVPSYIRFEVPEGGLTWEVSSTYQQQAWNFGRTYEIVQVQNILNEEFAPTVFPNPARDIVNFIYTLKETSDVVVKIYDQSGDLISEIKELTKRQDNDSMTKWDASQVPPGVYFATIEIKGHSGANQFEKKKIIIER